MRKKIEERVNSGFMEKKNFSKRKKGYYFKILKKEKFLIIVFYNK